MGPRTGSPAVSVTVPVPSVGGARTVTGGMPNPRASVSIYVRGVPRGCRHGSRRLGSSHIRSNQLVRRGKAGVPYTGGGQKPRRPWRDRGPVRGSPSCRGNMGRRPKCPRLPGGQVPCSTVGHRVRRLREAGVTRSPVRGPTGSPWSRWRGPKRVSKPPWGVHRKLRIGRPLPVKGGYSPARGAEMRTSQ